MSAFDRRYEPDQVEAFVHAYLDRKVRPLRVVCDMARNGQLITRDGRETRPFEANAHTFRGYITAERRRRAGKGRGSALDRPDDVLEGLRRRLIALADQELTHAERKRRGTRDIPHLSQIARLMREAAAIPKPGEGRSRQPGKRDENGRMVEGASEGMAGKLLAAHRRSTASEPLTEAEGKTENANVGSTTRSDTDVYTNEANAPGSGKRDSASSVRPLPTPHTRAASVAR